ncbi:uncharacterized protein BYT42DRAFT_582594 [Radiomyces spectabilis]|uniref:uncharacterized protein n=1 Tax=Radiomyces spectabilis TaxID=64574 RepID=UPI00221EFDCB|nr:uncharacterized protein BYT42DRAFT_582594 [Radiomyces spectabilis]KAI8370486.1 hypothetical protein BYT42DRAFT_582594 [Radiomyces spectabilis]
MVHSSQGSLPRPGDIAASPGPVACFLTGMAAILMGYSVYSHLKTLHDRNTAPNRRRRRALELSSARALEDAIPIKSLALLTQSTNVNIQNSAVKIVFERAMSEEYLPSIIEACKKEQPIESRSKALAVLQLLTRRDQNKTALLSAGALPVLVDALKSTEPGMAEITQRYVAVAICDLIQGSDLNKHFIIEMGILDAVKRILTSTTIRNNELKYWTLMVLYQISLTDPFPKILISGGFVKVLAKMARMTYGNTNMPKFCMQSLVRIVANVDIMEAKKILNELLDYRIVDLISVCLRSDDVELIYWAAGLMHEFVLKDVAAGKFRDIKGVHVILAGLLSAEEMYISRVVLRTVKFMAYGQEKFRQDMVRAGMVKKIMHCLTLDDDDVRYWAILCIHAVAGQVESHKEILNAPEFDLLLELAASHKIHVAVFVSDILSLICCITSNNAHMEAHLDNIIDTLNTLMGMEELEVQYNAAGAIFNVMAMRGDFAAEVRKKCLDTIISMCISSNHERVQLTCAKASLMLSIKYPSLVPRVSLQVVEPLITAYVRIAHRLLPIIMMQSLVSALKKDVAVAGAGRLSVHDNTDIEGLFVPDYINVNAEGTISNASRLEEMLQNSSRHNRIEMLNNNDILLPSNLSISAEPPTIENPPFEGQPASSSSLFGASSSSSSVSSSGSSPSPSDRISAFMDFELPTVLRVQFVGAQSALSVLLENDDIVDTLVTGSVLERLMADMAELEAGLGDGVTSLEEREPAAPLRLADYNTASMTAGNEVVPLPDSVRQLTEMLVFMALYPVLDHWCLHVCKNINLDKMDEVAAKNAYYEVLPWIQRSVSVMVDPRSPLRPPRPQTYAPSDSSSDSEGTQDGFSAQRPVESAAERLGETRRRGEEKELLRAKGRSAGYSKLYAGFASRAILVLRSLLRYPSLRYYLIYEMNFLDVLMYIFHHCPYFSSHVLTCLGILINSDPHYILPEHLIPVVAISVWKTILGSTMQKTSSRFYARLIMSYTSRCTHSHEDTAADGNPCDFAELDLVAHSRFCVINYETRLEVRNDAWTFETVRGTHPVPARHHDDDDQRPTKYAYEVVLGTAGLMQVGWVNKACQIDPEGGTGVGDDNESYGFDGCRAKKWHGRFPTGRSSYGLEWGENDVITCALDMQQGHIRYYKNGEDMGIAFENVPTDRDWYPAASLSTGQQCMFRFGGSIDSLQYLPEGYTPMAELARLKPISVVSSPADNEENTAETGEKTTLEGLAIHAISSIEENDIADLAEAMERMRVTSPASAAPPPEEHVKTTQAIPENEASENQDTNHDSGSAVARNTLEVRFPGTKNYYAPPSLYFEVAIAYHQEKIDLLYPRQEQASLIIGLQSLGSHSNVELVYDYQQKQAQLYQGQMHRSEPFSMTIMDGDCIGLFFNEENQQLGITWNGSVYAFVPLVKEEEKFRPFVPYKLGNAKMDINFGEKPFSWQRANTLTCKGRLTSYLSRLLGQ